MGQREIIRRPRKFLRKIPQKIGAPRLEYKRIGAPTARDMKARGKREARRPW